MSLLLAFQVIPPVPPVPPVLQTFGATNYTRNRKHSEPDYSAAVGRALLQEVKLRHERNIAVEKLEKSQEEFAAKTPAKAPSKIERDYRASEVAYLRALEARIVQYDAEIDAIRTYEIGLHLRAIQRDEQDMMDILFILALD